MYFLFLCPSISWLFVNIPTTSHIQKKVPDTYKNRPVLYKQFLVLTFQTNMVCFCKNASNYFLSNRFFLFPKILFLIKSWKIKKANPESIFNIMIFVTTFVSYTYWNLARKPHLRQVILALVFVQFVYTFCTLFFLWSQL